jgi:hypothetical protein
MTKDCGNCKYSIHEEHGYSNYTVEGTHTDCLLKLNPDLPVDRGWRMVPIPFAEKCPRYTPGGGVEVDVDREMGILENYSDDEELKALLRVWDR